MVCAEIPCTNHAKPSLRSGTDLKVKPMLDGRAYAREKIHPEAIITNVRQMPLVQEIIEKTSLYYM